MLEGEASLVVKSACCSFKGPMFDDSVPMSDDPAPMSDDPSPMSDDPAPVSDNISSKNPEGFWPLRKPEHAWHTPIPTQTKTYSQTPNTHPNNTNAKIKIALLHEAFPHKGGIHKQKNL